MTRGLKNMTKDIEYVSNLNLQGNQLKSAVIENVEALPTGVKGQVVYLTAETGSGYYYHDGSDWKLLVNKTDLDAVNKALGDRLTAVEGQVGGGSGEGSLASKVTALETTVNGADGNGGLVKSVADNTAAIAKNKTDIATAQSTASDAQTKANANATEIGSDDKATSVKGRIKALETTSATDTGRIDALEESVGKTASTGLRGDVAALKTKVGDATEGLVKDVADLQTEIANKANSADVYTTTQADEKIKVATDAAAANAIAIKALQDADYLPKTLASTTYRTIGDSYSQTEVDDKITAKLSSAYQVKGTKTYAQLASAEKVNGYVYNVSDPFSFDGKNYPAGTNVVWVGDAESGQWDPLAGVTDLSAYPTTTQMNSAIDTKIENAGHATTEALTEGLALKVDKTTAVNGHALSANVTVTAADVGLGNVENTADKDKVISTKTQAALDKKVDKLVTKPAGGTYTKVTINAEGQVTSGANLAAADIPSLTAAKITDFAASVKQVRYVHTYSDVGTTLAVEHNLGIEYPQVSVYKGSAKVEATVEYNDINKVTISGNIALGSVTVVVSP